MKRQILIGTLAVLLVAFFGTAAFAQSIYEPAQDQPFHRPDAAVQPGVSTGITTTGTQPAVPAPNQPFHRPDAAVQPGVSTGVTTTGTQPYAEPAPNQPFHRPDASVQASGEQIITGTINGQHQLVAKNGTVYNIETAMRGDELMGHTGKKVTVTGTVHELGGPNQTIRVESFKVMD